MGKKRHKMKHHHQGYYTGIPGGYNTACHVGPINVMTLNKSIIYAGSMAEFRDKWDYDLIIRFKDDYSNFDNPDPVDYNSEAANLLPNEVLRPRVPPILEVTWADFDTPHLDAEWWAALFDFLISDDRPEGFAVAIHCVGGHGRTGTALAILAALGGENDPVEFIRRMYCPSAVESSAQIEYIENMTGLFIGSEPAWDWRSMQMFQPHADRNFSATSSGTDTPQTTTTKSGTYSNHEWECTVQPNGTYHCEKKQKAQPESPSTEPPAAQSEGSDPQS